MSSRRKRLSDSTSTRRKSPLVVPVAIFDRELREKTGKRATCARCLPGARLSRDWGYKREEPAWWPALLRYQRIYGEINQAAKVTTLDLRARNLGLAAASAKSSCSACFQSSKGLPGAP